MWARARVTEEEWREIEAAANRVGKSPSEFIRETLLDRTRQIGDKRSDAEAPMQPPP